MMSKSLSLLDLPDQIIKKIFQEIFLPEWDCIIHVAPPLAPMPPSVPQQSDEPFTWSVKTRRMLRDLQQDKDSADENEGSAETESRVSRSEDQVSTKQVSATSRFIGHSKVNGNDNDVPHLSLGPRLLTYPVKQRTRSKSGAESGQLGTFVTPPSTVLRARPSPRDASASPSPVKYGHIYQDLSPDMTTGKETHRFSRLVEKALRPLTYYYCVVGNDSIHSVHQECFAGVPQETARLPNVSLLRLNRRLHDLLKPMLASLPTFSFGDDNTLNRFIVDVLTSGQAKVIGRLHILRSVDDEGWAAWEGPSLDLKEQLSNNNGIQLGFSLAGLDYVFPGAEDGKDVPGTGRFEVQLVEEGDCTVVTPIYISEVNTGLDVPGQGGQSLGAKVSTGLPQSGQPENISVALNAISRHQPRQGSRDIIFHSRTVSLQGLQGLLKLSWIKAIQTANVKLVFFPDESHDEEEDHEVVDESMDWSPTPGPSTSSKPSKSKSKSKSSKKSGKKRKPSTPPWTRELDCPQPMYTTPEDVLQSSALALASDSPLIRLAEQRGIIEPIALISSAVKKAAKEQLRVMRLRQREAWCAAFEKCVMDAFAQGRARPHAHTTPLVKGVFTRK